MTPLLDKILEHIPYDTITDTELSTLLDGSKASRHNQLKRVLAKGELLHIRRGIYHLAKRYQRKPLNPYELAQKVYGPSYISFESALSYHGLIPEAVYSVSSACMKRSREFKTAVGVYSFTQIPQRVFYIGVERIEKDGEVFLMAAPIKALADYVFYHRSSWTNIVEFLKSLRIEISDLHDLKVDREELDALMKQYQSKKVVRLLEELRKELAL
jgi:predicted transcriptional regulator of viral defense system